MRSPAARSDRRGSPRGTRWRPRALGAAWALVLAAAGCATTPPEPTDDWWNHPDRYAQGLAAIGASTQDDLAEAQREAELDARAQLAATVSAHVRSIHTTWARRAGAGQELDTWIERQGWVEQTARAALVGSWPVRYERVGKTLYCLVVMRSPAQLYRTYREEARARLDEVPGAGPDAEARLQEVVADHEARLREARAQLQLEGP